MSKILYLFLLLPLSAMSQDPVKKLAKIFEDDQVKPTVLLLGVFHFAGEQVDANNIPSELRIDMLSAERQQQQARAVGRWLVTTRRGSNTEPIGADGFITRYFNRNLRIYSNIQRIVDRKDDRILVIYGATHLYFLKTIFEASPEFKLEDVLKYL